MMTLMLLVVVGLGCYTSTPLDPTGVSSVTDPTGTRAADEFVDAIGVVTHLRYGGLWTEEFETLIVPRIKALGVRHLRDGGIVKDDSGWMDQVYTRFRTIASETGADFTLIVWPHFDRPNHINASHVEKLVGRVGLENVAALEGLNEYDTMADVFGGSSLVWDDQVKDYQRALFEEVRTLRYDIPVIGPSIAHPTNASRVGDLTEYMDLGNIHSYPGGQSPLTRLMSVISGMRVINGTKPVVATETGYHTATASNDIQHSYVSEEAQAKYTLRLLFEYFKAGVVRTFIYQLMDEGTDFGDVQQHFGLVRYDGSEKPAYKALRNLISILEDPGPSHTPGGLDYELLGDTTGVHQALLQKRDGRFYLVLWQETSSFDSESHQDIRVDSRRITLSLTQPFRRLVLYQPVLSSQPLTETTNSSQAVVDVPDHPLIIELALQ